MAASAVQGAGLRLLRTASVSNEYTASRSRCAHVPRLKRGGADVEKTFAFENFLPGQAQSHACRNPRRKMRLWSCKLFVHVSLVVLHGSCTWVCAASPPNNWLTASAAAHESYVYAPIPAATSYGHRAELWNPVGCTPCPASIWQQCLCETECAGDNLAPRFAGSTCPQLYLFPLIQTPLRFLQPSHICQCQLLSALLRSTSHSLPHNLPRCAGQMVQAGADEGGVCGRPAVREAGRPGHRCARQFITQEVKGVGCEWCFMCFGKGKREGPCQVPW